MTRIYTVSPGRPFLRTLAEAILAGDLPAPGGAPPDPISLASYALMLPTRRATRALQEAFLAASGGAALLLPAIRPIAEGQEDLSLVASAADPDRLGSESADIPPAISEIQRRLVLTELVMKWSDAMRDGDDAIAPVAEAGASTPAQAAHLAQELARLMDLVETENVSLDALSTLVPADFAEHWGKTLDFLKIAVEMWPAYLKETGLLSSVDRRNRVILSEAKRLAAMPPAGPVIVAGVTGSVPATAELMKAVARLPNGAIVLPGLDTTLDDDAWRLVAHHPEHPQFNLARLIGALGVDRRDIVELKGRTVPLAVKAARNRLISEAMRPAESTAHWHAFAEAVDPAPLRDGLDGVHLIEAPTAQDEAEAIALILRHAVETPGRTAALVSPDRLLARRVGVRLAAWGILVDDSAGRPFAKTVPGAFLDLVLDTIEQDFAPAPLMALLKHPLARLGLPVSDIRRAARFLELTAFRTIYLGRGLDGVDAALERAAREAVGDSDLIQRRHRSVRRLWEADWQKARDLVARMRTCFAPWLALTSSSPIPLRDLARAHVATAEALAALPPPAAPDTESEAVPIPLWQGEAGETAQQFFTALLDETLRAPNLAAADYPEFYRSLVAGEAVRPRVPVHPRISIWGPFEARLQQPDVVILGSLNEGTWPEAADPGPWLNRPMRAALKLPAPEEKICHAAHDFVSLTGADAVYLTRAMKVAGVPTVPSRWLMRLTALLDGLGLRSALEPDQPWLAWARARNLTPAIPPLQPPAPVPPVALRPRQLSVTEVERWIANPYAIYARRVLGLEALPPLGQEPDAALKGTIIHAALGRFAARHPLSLPADIERALLAEALAVLTDYTGHPRVAAFWLPRFERFAAWFAETESERRAGLLKVAAEVNGRHIMSGPAGPFALTARADRVDVMPGGLRLIDYKTGNPPNAAKIARGVSPQLALEAAIAAADGFANIPPAPVTALGIIQVTGGEPPGKHHTFDKLDIAAAAANAREGLAALIALYDQASTPYAAKRRSAFKSAYDYDEYAHLARVAEWTGAEVGDEAEGGAAP